MLFSGASGSTIGRKYYLSKRYRKISKIHPLTIILILLVAGNLAGLLGISSVSHFTQSAGPLSTMLLIWSKRVVVKKVTNAVLLGNETNTKENNG